MGVRLEGSPFRKIKSNIMNPYFFPCSDDIVLHVFAESLEDAFEKIKLCFGMAKFEEISDYFYDNYVVTPKHH